MGHLWYVAYGTNINEDRFNYYIHGGFCPFNGKTYRGCSEKNAPIDKRTIEIPYNFYYGYYGSNSWNNKGISFLDLSKPGHSYGVAYLVTVSQLHDIHAQEGHRTYDKPFELGEIDGIPAVTYTHSTVLESRKPSIAYIDCIKSGLKTNYPQLTDDEISAYLLNSEDAANEYLLSNDYVDEIADNRNELCKATDFVYEPVAKPQITISNGSTHYQRNAQVKANALNNADYNCELSCGNHTFINRSSGHNFMEVHHLIPLSMQDRFENSLDVEANLICLCSNCHSFLHFGKDNKDAIESLYNQRKELLQQCGINIDLNQLLAMYR